MLEPSLTSEVVGATQDDLLALAHHLVGNRADAEDLVQEAWASALAQPPGRIGRLRAWLRAALVHGAGRQRRRARSREIREADVARREALPSTADAVERAAFLRELGARLDGLSDPYREILRLRFLEDLEPEEIARRLARPPGTVRSQLKRGLDRLRGDLDRRYGDRRSWAALVLAPARSTLAPGPVVLGPLALAGGGVAAALALVWILAGGARRERDRLAVPTPPTPLAAAAPSAASPPAARQALAGAPAAVASARVRVHAVGLDGGAVGDLRLELEPRSGESDARSGDAASAPLEGRTDASGRLELAELAPGAWRLSPERGPARLLELEPGETEDVELEIPAGRALLGRLVEGDAPVAGGEVLLSVPGRSDRFRVVATSDADGRFRLEGVDDDAWIAARKEGFAPSHAYAPCTLGPDPVSGEIRIGLARTGRVRGRVLDPGGGPVSGARIFTRALDSERASPSGMGVRIPACWRELVADADGRFEVDKDSALVQRFVVVADGFAPLACASRRRGTEAEELEWTLAPPAELAGRVLGPDGRGRPGVVIEVELPAPLPPLCATSDAAGSFRIGGLPAGSLAVSARDPVDAAGSELSAFLRVDLVAGEERALPIELGLRATIRGRLVDASGAPLVNRRIVLEEQQAAWDRLRAPWSSDPARLRTARSGADGTFAFGGLAPIGFELRAVEGDDPLGPVLAGLRDVRPGGDARVLRASAEVATGSLFGVVAADEPVRAGAFVSLRSRAVARELRLELDPASGRFASASIPAGDWIGRVFLPGRTVWELGRIRVAAGERRDLGTIVLPAPGSLRLALLDPSGTGVGEADVVVVGRGSVVNTAVDADGIRRESDGAVLVEPLWPGEYQVAVFAPGFADHRTRASVREGEAASLEVRLVPGIAVELGVASARALEPRAKLDLEIEQAGEVVYLVHADPSEEAAHLFHDRVRLAPGPARLAVSAGPGRRVELDFDAADLGPAARLEVELPPGEPRLD